MYSNTVQLQTYADAAGQGDELATFIARHANRAFASIGTPPPATTPSPQPTNEASTSLNKLFARKKKTAAAATPAPAATSAPVPVAVALAARTSPIAVLPVSGGAAVALRELALARAGEKTRGERAASAGAACGEHPHDAVLSGDLSSRADPASTGRGATFDATVKDCTGKTLWHGAYSADASGTNGAEVAVERAVDLAVDAYLHPPRKRVR